MLRCSLLLLIVALAACGNREILSGVTFTPEGALVRENADLAQQRLQRELASALAQRLGGPWRVAVAFDRPPRELLSSDGERLWRWQELDVQVTLLAPGEAGEPPQARAKAATKQYLTPFVLPGGLLAVEVTEGELQDL